MIKHSWSGQHTSKVIKSFPGQMEEYFSKDFADAIERHRSPTLKKNKRYRSAFTTDQVNYLENEFKKFPYIGAAQRKEVANTLNINERAVKIWFQNRRMKEKKDISGKDQCDDQIRRNFDIINDRANNVVTAPVAGPSFSLSQTGTIQNNVDNISENDIFKIENDEAMEQSPFKPNFYTDISPVREPHSSKTTCKNIASTLTSNNKQLKYRSSGEFSIDLCKKYKSNFHNSPQRNANSSNSLVTVVETTPPQNKSQDKNPRPEVDIMPEDLSCKGSKQQDLSIQKSLDPSNPGYVPLYVNYPQPYLSAGNMLWKPVNVLPIVPTGVPAVNLAAGASGSTNQEHTAMASLRKPCNCDCHMDLPRIVPKEENPNPQAQYVITAMPFQNFTKQ